MTASVPRFSEAGFLYAQILLLLVIPSALVFMHSWGYDQRSYGLFVHLYADHIPKTGSDSCVQAWTVQVDSDQHWFLNEQEITPSVFVLYRGGDRIQAYSPKSAPFFVPAEVLATHRWNSAA